ncbi:hypothetical protein [Streptomyces sp. NPDC058614]|uniref:hypothetical protein n=1 Tax=Streptomyces sp. NPDC058614 TaxID=3346557 RepID=UPI0036466F0F
MADDHAGGRILGFPGLTIPGPVGSGPPPPGASTPSLTPLPALAPPPSLMVAASPALTGRNTVAVHPDPGMPNSPQGAGIAAMSVVMMAGITVAAMRGAWNAAAYLKARHEHHRAIADQQRMAADRTAIGLETARQKGRMQSGPEFGRNTRTSGVGGVRTNSARNSTPGTFRSAGGPKSTGSSGARTPGKTPGGFSGSRTGTLGGSGRGGGSGGRSGALGRAGAKSAGRTGVGGGKTGSSGTKSGSGSLSGAVRDRAAGRIRNGPAPRTGGGKNGTGTRGTSGKSGSGAATGSSGSKSGRGFGSKPGTGATGSGKGRVTLPKAVADGASRRLQKRRKRLSPPVLSTVRKGMGTKGGGKPGSGSGSVKRKGKGRVTLPAAIVAESARRLKRRRKRLSPPVLSTVRKGKKGKTTAAGTPPGTTPKVDLTKKPKTPGSSGGPATAPKVDLTKKRKPKPGSGGAAGTGGTAPKVNLRKKVNLRRKTRRYGRPGGCFPGPKPTGSTGTGPTGTGPAGTGPTGSGPKPGGPSGTGPKSGSSRTGPGTGTGGGSGPPPGWGHTKGYTVTIERADGGPGSQVRRPAGAITRGRPGLPAGKSRGGTPVTVPVRTKAPNTQYGDSELTIFDVIESDADMAEEIMAGVDEARAAADGCEKMMTRLEALHARIVDLKVPGVLEGWILLLVDKATSVKAKAEALAEQLPAASEAIRTAGDNAERRHKPLADAVRDAGHTAPAERDYHVD